MQKTDAELIAEAEKIDLGECGCSECYFAAIRIVPDLARRLKAANEDRRSLENRCEYLKHVIADLPAKLETVEAQRDYLLQAVTKIESLRMPDKILISAPERKDDD